MILITSTLNFTVLSLIEGLRTEIAYKCDSDWGASKW